MQQGDKTTNIAIALHSPAGEAEHIKLVVGGMQDAILHLSLPQARSLATTLIQHVHRAEVISSMKNPRQKPTPATEPGTHSLTAAFQHGTPLPTMLRKTTCIE